MFAPNACLDSIAFSLIRMRVSSLAVALIVAAGLVSADSAIAQATADRSPRLIRVGPAHEVKTIAEAARLARDGDTVEIEGGDYRADVAVWTQRRLNIRGVNGRPRLIADGASAEGKAIWVLRGGDITITNIAFTGARVADRNGAGIRFESGRLAVRHCLFADNENSILGANDPEAVVEIEATEFARNGAGDGQSHNLYIGAIRRLVVTASYSHDGRVGHLLKSRARENLILYNRLTDEHGGRASYELEFPAGGLAIVLGNVIEQSAITENGTIISFGAEGYKWSRNELYLSHNTIVNDRLQGGAFVSARPGTAYVLARNNVLVGRGDMSVPVSSEIRDNPVLRPSEFADIASLDYRLKRRSKTVGTAVEPGAVGEISLRPTREYVHPLRTAPISGLLGLSPGALQTLAP